MVLSIGGYKKEFKHITDVDFFIRVGLKARSVYAIDKPLGTYRIHQSNLHKTLNQENIADYEYIKLFKKIAQEYDIQESLKSQALKNLFPVLTQSITKTLRNNKLAQGSDLVDTINRSIDQHRHYLISGLTGQGKIIYGLSDGGKFGIFLAWLIVKAWESINTLKSSPSQNRQYNLSELTKLSSIN